MMRLSGLLLVAGLPAFAQGILNPARLAPGLRSMEPTPGEQRLICSVTPIPPALNFSLRIQAGYSVKVPMSQYLGKGHRWAQIIRVTPRGDESKPVFLGYRIDLPDVPANKVDVELGGGYLVGEGSYDVSWAMYDDQHRVCRKEWRVEAKLKRQERKVPQTMAPHTVAAFSLVGHAKPAPQAGAGKRVTVLLHAAPLSPRRLHFRETDRMMLLGALSALMEQIPAARVRVVAFNLDKQKELYRQENFHPEMIDDVQKALDQLELELTDVNTLQHPLGPVELVSSLVNQELFGDAPSDLVLFFGPRSRYIDQPPRFELTLTAPPRFVALQFRSLFRLGGPPPQGVPSDLIANTVGSLKGRVFTLRTPADFASALRALK